jgi:hypothetical protein
VPCRPACTRWGARCSGVAKPTAVYLEVASKKVFACAFDWPGWARSGRDEEAALDALAAYAARYEVVAREAGLPFVTQPVFDVVERLPGTTSTDFGVPAAIPERDRKPLPGKEAERLCTLVAAAWTVLDRVVAGAPAELRKGPRGGGRDRDKMVDHVLGAEKAYGPKLGIPARQVSRDTILAALRSGDDTTWPRRYAARRIAWHALDHAWEIEDRST